MEILTASDPEEGLDLFCSRHPQIVLTDLMMPHMSGMEVLERIMEIDPATDVILMTAHYSTESAVEAIRKGASDYLNKPVSLGLLRERIGKLVEEARKRQRSLQLEDELRTTSGFEGIVGRSPQMWEMFSRIRRVAPHYRAAADHRGDGNGEGPGGPRAAPAESRWRRAAMWFSTAPPWWRRCLKANCLAT